MAEVTVGGGVRAAAKMFEVFYNMSLTQQFGDEAHFNVWEPCKV